MRPELVSLGPWSLAVLPVVIAVVYAIALFWRWAEYRWGGASPLTVKTALIVLLPAAAIAAAIFLLVNRFGPVSIKSWGTMLVIGFAAGTGWAARFGDRKIITPSECLDFALFCLIGAVIGARLLFVALEWSTYAAHPGKLLNVWEGGLSFHGGLLGAIIGAWTFCRVRRKSFPAVLDVSAPGVALGYFFARFGCFLNGCCHGNVCDLPWRMRFPYSDTPNLYVHPAQLYSMIAAVIMFVVLVKLRGKFPRHGHLFLAFLALYSVYRFLVEFARAGATGRLLHMIPWMTWGQLASLAIFAAAVLVIVLTWPRRPAER